MICSNHWILKIISIIFSNLDKAVAKVDRSFSSRRIINIWLKQWKEMKELTWWECLMIWLIILGKTRAIWQEYTGFLRLELIPSLQLTFWLWEIPWEKLIKPTNPSPSTSKAVSKVGSFAFPNLKMVGGWREELDIRSALKIKTFWKLTTILTKTLSIFLNLNSKK